MSKSPLHKMLLVFACGFIIMQVQANTRQDVSMPPFNQANTHSGMWTLIIIILVVLLILSYILTKAINKRVDK